MKRIEAEIQESGIREIEIGVQESGIRNQDSGIRKLELEIRVQELASGIRNYRGIREREWGIKGIRVRNVE
jgi:hypothetical protein